MVPEDWEVKRIRDVAEVIGGGTPSTKNKSYWNGTIAWITPKDLSNHKTRYIKNGERNITEAGLKHSSAKILPKGAVLLTTRAPVGYLVIAENEVTTNQGFRSLIPNENTTTLFLFYLLKKNIGVLKSNASGTTFGELSGSRLKSLIFPFPSLLEQQAISKTLSCFDSKIELNQQMNKALETIGQAFFKHWFVDFEFPNEEGKPYKSSSGEMVKSELGEIPKEWKVVPNISELCDRINYGYTQSASDDEVGPKFLRVTDINKGDWIDWTKVPHCRIEEKIKHKYLLRKGDIVIARMADPGKVAIFESDIPALFASYLIRIRLKNTAHAYYLYYLMKSKTYQGFISGAASGSVQRNLNAKGLTNGLPIVLPKDDTICLLNRLVERIRQKINDNLFENGVLAQIRDSLLPKLMSGEIRVKVSRNADS